MTAASLRGRYGKSDFLAHGNNALDVLADLLGGELAERAPGPDRRAVALAHQHAAHHGGGGDTRFLALPSVRSPRPTIRAGESVDRRHSHHSGDGGLDNLRLGAPASLAILEVAGRAENRSPIYFVRAVRSSES